MTIHSKLVLAALCASIMLNSAFAAKHQKTVTITDHVGIDWRDELVHYEMTFKPGELPSKASARVTGPNGKPILHQISNVRRYDEDGSIQSFNVWFFASVKPNASATYKITAAKRGKKGTGVAIKYGDSFAELTTHAQANIGIRMLIDEKNYDWPIPAADVPGPIQALLLPSGRWTGQGRMEVPFKVKSYKSEITAHGPLFAEVTSRYEFDTGYWQHKAKVVMGSPMIIISEELDNGFNEQDWDKVDRFFTLVLNDTFKPKQMFFGARNNKPHQETLIKSGMKEEWTALGRVRDGWFGSPVHGYELSFEENRDDFYLTGYVAQTPRIGCLFRLIEPGGDAIGFAGLDTTTWKNAMSLRFSVNTDGEALLRMPLQVYKQAWAADGYGRTSPNYTGKTLFVPATTARRVYGIMLSRAEDEKKEMLESLFRMQAKLTCNPLDEVKDWILDWPDPMAGEAWSIEATTAGTNALDLMRGRIAFKRILGDLGRFSMGYHYGFAKGQYPGVMKVMNDLNALTAADRKELRSLAAYVAYDINTFDTFPWGAGFHLNNPNMSIMAVEARTKSSLLVKDHPMFTPWGQWTLEFLKNYIRRYTRDSGALYENPHYSLGVTLSWSAQVNNVLMDAGIGDAFDTALFKKGIRFALDWLSPPDPRFKGHRVVLPLGNCSYQSISPEFATIFVNYYKDRDPEFAGKIQWAANQTLPDNKKVKIVDEVIPQLKSVHYEGDGVSFRHGFGTPHETLFRMIAGNCDGHYEWESDQMSYTLYAKGQPINLHFGNGYFPMFCRPWMRNKISIDHKFVPSERNETKVIATALGTESDYLRAVRDVDQIRALKTEYPVLDKRGRWGSDEKKSWPTTPTNLEDIPLTKWYRQVLFLKDPDPKGPNYFVISDAFGGTPTRPTDLSFWFLANEMTETNGYYHFDGQCEVDMDVFVCSPHGQKPHTDSYGHVQQPYRRLTGFDPKYFPGGKRAENQLLLRLKQPPAKGYMVVLYPRLKKDDPAAKFTRLTDKVVRVETMVSTDYVFMYPYLFTYKDDKIDFRGTAAAIRFYKDGRIVVINNESGTTIKVAGKTVSGSGPFTVTLKDGKADKALLADDAWVEVR